MTRWCIVRPSGKPARCGRRWRSGWTVWAAVAPGQDQDRVLQGRQAARRYEHTSFTFLGYTFQPRGAKDRDGKLFVRFQPAVSTEALAKMGEQVRRWRLHLRTRHDLDELAEWLNPIVAGWMNYYGRFYRSRLYPLLQRINTYLMRWAGKKYKRLRVLQAVQGVVVRDHRSRPRAVRPLAVGAHVRRIAVRRAE